MLLALLRCYTSIFDGFIDYDYVKHFLWISTKSKSNSPVNVPFTLLSIERTTMEVWIILAFHFHSAHIQTVSQEEEEEVSKWKFCILIIMFPNVNSWLDMEILVRFQILLAIGWCPISSIVPFLSTIYRFLPDFKCTWILRIFSRCSVHTQPFLPFWHSDFGNALLKDFFWNIRGVVL